MTHRVKQRWQRDTAGSDTGRHINAENWHTRVNDVANDCCKLSTRRTLETESKQGIYDHVEVTRNLIGRWHRVDERQFHLETLSRQSVVQRLVRSLWIENTRIVALQMSKTLQYNDHLSGINSTLSHIRSPKQNKRRATHCHY